MFKVIDEEDVLGTPLDKGVDLSDLQDNEDTIMSLENDDICKDFREDFLTMKDHMGDCNVSDSVVAILTVGKTLRQSIGELIIAIDSLRAETKGQRDEKPIILE